MRVVLTAKAEADLLRITDHIAENSPMCALTLVRELRRAALNLANSHDTYPVLARYRQARLRRCIHGNYLIFFRVDAQQVVIVRVLHGAMDLDTYLT